MQQIMVKAVVMGHCCEKQQDMPPRTELEELTVKLRITDVSVTAWFLSFR